ncbi:MAG: translation initiation factor IF-3 [Candidatus Nealsonbacteria bacterium]|nr:translation initiation factor IF-3 [Candidatus Nealsonbacteria bacterium]
MNNQIRSRSVRVVDETGGQLGIMELERALKLSIEKGLDLIQVTEKVEPPVCRIMDYGKYIYHQEKKNKKLSKKSGELKQIRLGFNISLHDLETKANLAEKFFKKGDKVRIGMRLRGRERAFGNLAKEKINNFLKILNEKIPFKVEKELKMISCSLSMIIAKKDHEN